jgi:hypothetical protein
MRSIHLLRGTKLYRRSAPAQLGSPWAQLPTMRTTLSGFLPRRACATMGLKLPMASTSKLAVSLTCASHTLWAQGEGSSLPSADSRGAKPLRNLCLARTNSMQR